MHLAAVSGIDQGEGVWSGDRYVTHR